MQASQGGRVALFVGSQVEVSRVEFVLIGLQCANGGFDQVHALLVQRGISGFAAIAAASNHGFNSGAPFQLVQGFGQQLTVIHVI